MAVLENIYNTQGQIQEFPGRPFFAIRRLTARASGQEYLQEPSRFGDSITGNGISKVTSNQNRKGQIT